MRTKDALAVGMALGRIRGTLDAWEESKHPRQPDGRFGSGGSSSKPKVITKTGGVTGVSGGGSKGQLNITKKGNESYVMLQATKKDGSWGKPQMTKLMFKEELENPELALKRIQELNPGRQWRFAPEE